MSPRICIFSAPGRYTHTDTHRLNTYHRSHSQIEQEQLEVIAAQKDPQRFGVLYERYYEQIFLFIFKRLHDEDQTADLCSQVFLKCMLNLQRYTFKGVPFSSWLYRIAINEVNQYFREHKNQRHISLESSGLQLMIEETEQDGTDQNIRQLVQALDQLKQEEVQMVELRYFERMPFKEVAQIYNITENNAKVRMYRILSKLKKQLASKSI